MASVADSLDGLIHGLNKAELHLHLEGSVEPETVIELDPSLKVEEVRARYHHTDFAGFIQGYIWINRKLQRPEHYGLITRRLLERLALQNVTWAEINLSAGVILWKEQNFSAIFDAVAEAAEAQSAVEVRWIFDAVRQFGAADAQRVAELAAERTDRGVVGFGIGGDEAAGPCGWFRDVFAFAKQNGLALLPHAGETAGAESVAAALDCGADRIGHGIRSIDDPGVMRELRDRNIPLEVCMTSNVCTGSVASLEDHPVRRLFDAGVPITLNTDDPALFRTTLEREYRVASDVFGFSERELRSVAQNAWRYRCSGANEPAASVQAPGDQPEQRHVSE
ncbi:MAG TPA: adenosine deaminase [Bryobacteraceae bacterium]|nr:adenosine deaminase [Bryobacteraceae bacterium]